jgi:hypothetical protein
MKRLLILTGILPLIIAPALPANAAIHEMVAAFCSGGDVGVIEASGHLEPPGVTNPALESFRKPATASGVVDTSGGAPVIGTSPAAKYPAGTPVPGLNVSSSNHPSAQHCANVQTAP